MTSQHLRGSRNSHAVLFEHCACEWKIIKSQLCSFRCSAWLNHHITLLDPPRQLQEAGLLLRKVKQTEKAWGECRRRGQWGWTSKTGNRQKGDGCAVKSPKP